MTKKTYQAVCDRCYTCVIATSTKKSDVERAATSHINQFHHTVFITSPISVPVDEAAKVVR